MNCTVGQTIAFALIAGTAAATVITEAYAQDQESAERGKVRVTGLMISGTDIATHNPVVVVAHEDIDRTGLIRVGETPE